MSALDHARRIHGALEIYVAANHQLAVEEPDNDFERSVNELHELQALVKEVKDLLKPVENQERELRTSLAQSLRDYFGDELKVGVNSYPLSNGRKFKLTHKVDRKIDNSMIAAARATYAQAADAPLDVTFDDLIRPKYEVVAKEFKKLAPGGAAAKAFAMCYTTTLPTPTLEVD